MRRGKHPAQISLSIHASDEGAFIATPLDPPASLSLFPGRGIAESLIPKEPQFTGVFAVLVGRAKMLVWDVIDRGRAGPKLVRREAFVNHYLACSTTPGGFTASQLARHRFCAQCWREHRAVAPEDLHDTQMWWTVIMPP